MEGEEGRVSMKLMVDMITHTVIFCFCFSLENQRCLRKPSCPVFVTGKNIFTPTFYSFFTPTYSCSRKSLTISHRLIYFCFRCGNRIFPVLSEKIVKNAEIPKKLTDISLFLKDTFWSFSRPVLNFHGHFCQFIHGRKKRHREKYNLK